MDLHDIAPGLSLDPAGFWLAPEQVQVSYPDDGNDYCLTMEDASFWFTHRNRAIIAAVRRHPPAGGPIFDVGAGNGYVSAGLETAGFSTIAIEPNRAGAANAAARRISRVVCGSLPSNAFRTGTAGAIGLFDVLEHVEADRDFLQALRQYLKPGGRLYLATPAFPRLWSEDDVHAGHFRRYTTATLAAVVAAAGYRVEYATYFFWCLPLPIFLFRTLRTSLQNGRSQTSSRREHTLGGAALRRLAGLGLGFEIGRIAHGKSIPFGGSCLLVASATSS